VELLLGCEKGDDMRSDGIRETGYVTELCCPDCLSDVVTRGTCDRVVGVAAILELECESCGKVFHVGLKWKGVLK